MDYSFISASSSNISPSKIPSSQHIMASRQFYLLGDAVTSSRAVHVDPREKLDDLKKSVGLAFHIAQPSGV